MSPSPELDPQWLRRFEPSGVDGFQLICFPYAGGSAGYYYTLSKLLAPVVDVLALQYPGRLDRFAEPSIDNVPDLAEAIYQRLRGLVDRPFAFFGHSMGSVVAFEVARRLEQRTGRCPTWLIASAYPAPSRLPSGSVHLRDDAGIVQKLREIGGMDAAWLEDADMLAVILPAIRADYRAIETYTWEPGPPLSCPITMLTGDADPHTTPDTASAWHEHTVAKFDQRVFSGGHFFLDEYWSELAGLVLSTLDRTPERDVISGGTS